VEYNQVRPSIILNIQVPDRLQNGRWGDNTVFPEVN